MSSEEKSICERCGGVSFGQYGVDNIKCRRCTPETFSAGVESLPSAGVNEMTESWFQNQATVKTQVGMLKELTAEDKTSHKTAVKLDEGKPDLSMISRELVELVALVRMFGSRKYARNNWKKGFKYSRSIAAALRHIFAFSSGEDNDPESGLSHIGHAICCLEHLLYDIIHHKDNDDRSTE